MINFYNLIFNKEKTPKLNLIKQYDCINKNMDIETIVSVLNETEILNELFTEHAYIVGFNNNMDVTGVYLVSSGNSKSCNFYKKNIFTFLLLSGSDRFIMLHNHPSNILEPSEQDLSVMYILESAANIFEIELIDSIIVCENGFYCMKRKDGVVYEDYEEDYI